MKITQAAVLGVAGAARKRLVDGLKKAGLKVSAAEEPGALRREQLVVVTGKNAARLAKDARAQVPGARVLAAQAQLSPSKWADAVLPLPVSPRDLKARLPELARLEKVGAEAKAGEGILDPLTGFYTFSHFKEVLFVEVKRARRYGFPLAIALIGFDPLDLPPAKELRTQLLGGLALAIRRSLRDTDYPVQYGNDRVLLLMPHTPLQGAVIVSKRICERVARASLTHNGVTVHPTISVGVSAGGAGNALAFADLARQAQQSLDTARNSGGNRVEFFDIAEEAGSRDDQNVPATSGE